MAKRELLFSVTKKDFRIDTFRSGGKGGQNQNTRDTGVRIVHPASGASGESREERSQGQNKRKAFQRLVNSKRFQTWHKLEIARRLGLQARIEDEVAKAMRPENLKIEVQEDGEWVEADG